MACIQRETRSTQLPDSTAAADTGDRVVATTLGESHACALTRSAIAYCWGSADGYLLGAGDSAADGQPVPVADDHRFRAIAAGRTFTCGVDLAGKAFCWGGGQKGQLGAGSFFDRANRPQPVAGGHLFLTIVAGREHVCAIDMTQAAWCWGDNSSGQLGDGSNSSSPRPVRVAGDQQFRQLGAGAESNATCGVTTRGAAFCWGANAHGVLGDGTTASSNVPVQVRGLADIAAVDAGADVSCALTNGHEVFCWGSNALGQLGLGTAVRDVEILSPTQHVRTGEKFISVSAGEHRACAVAWNGAAYCWGSTDENLLGTNADDSCEGRSYACARAPSLVRGNAQLSSVLVGPNARICGAGRRSSSPVFCWGRGLPNAAQKVTDATVVLLPVPVAATPVAATPVAVAPTPAAVTPAPVAVAPMPPARKVDSVFHDTSIDALARPLLAAATAGEWTLVIQQAHGSAQARGRYASLAPVLPRVTRPAGISELFLRETVAALQKAAAMRPPDAVLSELRIWLNAMCAEARADRQTACTELRGELLDAAEMLANGNVGAARAHLDLAADRAQTAEDAEALTPLEGLLLRGNIKAMLERL